MIKIEKAKEEFCKYRNLFDKENKNIERKFIHTMNVMYLCEVIAKNLNLNKEEILNVLQDKNRAENEIIYDIMLQIGKMRGAVISGGNVDDIKTANIILEDFRSGKLGRITLEKV